MNITFLVEFFYIFIFFSIFFGSLFYICDDGLYNIFVDLGIEQFFISVKLQIFSCLSIVHLFILYLLGYNRTKIM